MTRLALALPLLLALAAAAPSARAQEAERTRQAEETRPAEPSLHDRLIGTWKLTTARYNDQPVDFLDDSTMVKHITPTHFMWANYGEDGVVTRSAGGRYTLKGDQYEESPAYGLSADFDLIKGKPQSFTCVIEGDTWRHEGRLSNGLKIQEVWERVKE